MLAQHGAEVLNVDQVGHEVLTDSDVQAALRQRWGSSVFGPDGAVDRARVAGIVFAGDESGSRELEFLEQTTHPGIGRRIAARLDVLKRAGRTPVAVLDAALLIKAGWDRWCDWIVYVEAPVEQRLDRAKARGWDERQFAARESAQGPLEVKRRRACWMLDNSGTVADLAAQVDRLWAERIRPAVLEESPPTRSASGSLTFPS